ncbi:MAG: phosphotransferase family protein [Pseudonocardia sp.]|nr:phosphotransferase family protein [Pseudonocardia sp.]
MSSPPSVESGATAPDEAQLDIAALGTFLDAATGGLAGPLRARLLAGGRSNPTYAVTDGVRDWILRRPPHGLVLASAHDMGREVRVLRALHGTAVPVPEVIAFDSDGGVLGAPFYVMERLDGTVISTPAEAATLDPADRRRLGESMVDTLVALHKVDADAVGLGNWGRPEGFLDRQLRLWRRQWAAAHTAERPQVDALLDRLGAAVPTTRRTGIVHGDFKIDNVMVAATDPGSVLGVLDWEMSTRGDVLTDVGVLLSFWDEPGGVHNPVTRGSSALPGFPSRAEIARRYAAASGTDLADLDWYVVLADIKIAIILEQIHARHVQGHTVGDGFDDVGAMVDPLLARAVARADAAGIGP